MKLIDSKIRFNHRHDLFGKINQSTIEIPIRVYDDAVIGKHIKETNQWEPEITDFLSDYIKTKRDKYICLDIGAHVGYFSLILGQNPDLFIHSFEPHPDIYRVLQENTVGYPNILTHNYAVSLSNDIVPLYASNTNTGDNSTDQKEIEKWNKQDYKTISCFTKRLSDFYIPREKVGLVKIDTQGTEYDIFSVYALPEVFYIIEKGPEINRFIRKNKKHLVILEDTQYDYVFEILQKDWPSIEWL